MANALYHRRVLGEALRIYRKQAGMSQEKLAEKAELNPKYLSEVERGRKTISMDALVRIAKSLNIRIRELTLDF